MSAPGNVGHPPRVERSGRVSLLELVVVFAGLVALVGLELAASGSWSLLTQAPWLDECLTHLVVNDPSFRHGLAAIRGGVENTPPAFFTVMWPVARIFGGLSPLALRVMDCAFILLACVAVYGTCRLFVERERAAIGALVVAIHPAVVVQMFQVRFYGFWLAATAWLVYLTVRSVREPERRQLLYARCALAVLVAGSHWFGVIGVGLITAGDLMARRGARQRLMASIPLAAAVLALGLCAPLLRAQRTGLWVQTWIEPLTLGDAAIQARAILGPAPMLLLAAYGLWRLARRMSPRSDAAGLPAIAPGVALLLFPLVLGVLSLIMQPVFRSRYMIPAVIPVGMLAAIVSLPLTARGGRLLAAAAGVALVAVGAVEMDQLRRTSAGSVAAIDRAVAAADSLHAAGPPAPIVFLRRFEQQPVLQQRPELASASALVDFDGDGGGLSRLWVFERDMARRVARAYPQYRMASVDDLGRLDHFFVIARSQDEVVLRRLFPGHDIRPRSLSVYAAVRR